MMGGTSHAQEEGGKKPTKPRKFIDCYNDSVHIMCSKTNLIMRSNRRSTDLTSRTSHIQLTIATKKRKS